MSHKHKFKLYGVHEGMISKVYVFRCRTWWCREEQPINSVAFWHGRRYVRLMLSSVYGRLRAR